MNWFHKFFNPHCPDCAAERLEKKVCQSCETLREQLNQVNFEKKQLLDSILQKPVIEQPRIETEELNKINYRPWKVKQALLEAEDRKKAELIRKNEELEKELSIEEKPSA